MGFFDNLKKAIKGNNNSSSSSNNAPKQSGSAGSTSAGPNKEGTFKFSFNSLPKTLEELKALPEASMDTPFKTAALAILSLCIYSENVAEGIKCLNFLRGPKGELCEREKQFFNDRVNSKNGKLIAKSYFKGATPDNEYQAPKPYVLELFTNSHSYEQATYCTLHIFSGGADSERQVQLRVASGKWYLWEQFLMVGIKDTKSQNPWG